MIVSHQANLVEAMDKSIGAMYLTRNPSAFVPASDDRRGRSHRPPAPSRTSRPRTACPTVRSPSPPHSAARRDPSETIRTKQRVPVRSDDDPKHGEPTARAGRSATRPGITTSPRASPTTSFIARRRRRGRRRRRRRRRHRRRRQRRRRRGVPASPRCLTLLPVLPSSAIVSFGAPALPPPIALPRTTPRSIVLVARPSPLLAGRFVPAAVVVVVVFVAVVVVIGSCSRRSGRSVSCKSLLLT